MILILVYGIRGCIPSPELGCIVGIFLIPSAGSFFTNCVGMFSKVSIDCSVCFFHCTGNSFSGIMYSGRCPSNWSNSSFTIGECLEFESPSVLFDDLVDIEVHIWSVCGVDGRPLFWLCECNWGCWHEGDGGNFRQTLQYSHMTFLYNMWSPYLYNFENVELATQIWAQEKQKNLKSPYINAT